jgi:2-keto-4-pentenoate hydratase/2-oxohepta-3-ene-1,7-dioic acid hydratase in catechol pathway
MWARLREVDTTAQPHFALADVTLEAPVRPRKVLAIGLNYKDHIAESGLQSPAHQIWFNKQHNSITGPFAPVQIPSVSPFVDFEAEMVFVVGKRAKHVPRERAKEVIFGYCVGNDVTVRDWQMHTPQFTVAKSFDTHGPIGPWITTADEVGDPHDLSFSLSVNGVEKQSSNTRHLLFDCFDQVALLTQAFQLDPGDVIFTGTPGGVGALRDPREFLKAGDSVRITFDTLGAIENSCVAEEPRCSIG